MDTALRQLVSRSGVIQIYDRNGQFRRSQLRFVEHRPVVLQALRVRVLRRALVAPETQPIRVSPAVAGTYPQSIDLLERKSSGRAVRGFVCLQRGSRGKHYGTLIAGKPKPRPTLHLGRRVVVQRQIDGGASLRSLHVRIHDRTALPRARNGETAPRRPAAIRRYGHTRADVQHGIRSWLRSIRWRWLPRRRWSHRYTCKRVKRVSGRSSTSSNPLVLSYP